MTSQPHLALVSPSGNPHLYHVIERAPLLPAPNGSLNCLHGCIVDFDVGDPKLNASAAPEDVYDPSQLEITQIGKLVVIKYGAGIYLFTLDEHEDVAAIECPDWVLSTLAAGIRRAA